MDVAQCAGQWTLPDLVDLPEDGHKYEVIDGNLIVSPPSTLWHQAVGSELLGQLRAKCPPEWLAVFESYVDYGGDGRVPDLLVVRSDSLRNRRQLASLPAAVGLAIEVVSPTSRRTDRLAKPAEYADVGIPLMWRVELEPELALHSFRRSGASWTPTGVVTWRGLVDVPWGQLELDLTALQHLKAGS